MASLQNQVIEVRIQDKKGKQCFHENIKKVFEPVTGKTRNTSEKLTKTITETSVTNSKAIENLNGKILGIMIDKGIIASYLLSLLSKITNPENTSQFKLVKYPNSNRVTNLIHKAIPITL